MAGATGASGSNEPKTIREMLLWLHGLGQDDKTSDKQKLEDYITGELKNSLTKKSSSVSNAIEKITAEAKGLISTVCKEAGQIIVSIQKGEEYKDNEHRSALQPLTGEAKDKPFLYDNDDNKLYDQFLYHLTYCYWQLRLLYTVCNVNSAVGGWGQCMYGQKVSENYKECKDDKQQQNHDKRCSQCTKDKYKGCLMGFLTEGPMGWPKDKLPTSNKQGVSLHAPLSHFFSGHTNNFPKLLGHLKLLELLSTATHTSSQLSVPGTWIAGDLWAFFSQLWEFWQNKDNKQERKGFKDKLGQKIKEQYENGFRKEKNANGQTADYTDLNDVFSRLLFPGHGGSHPNCFRSLYDCDGGVGNNKDNKSNHCGKYLYSLLSYAFYWVLEWFKDNTSLLTFPTLQTLASGLKQKLQTFKEELEKKDCVKNNSSCQCIVWCDDTHSYLYQHALTFHSPLSLAVKQSNGQDDTSRTGAQKRKCKDLKDQLEEVIGPNGALDVFMKLEKYVPSRAPLTIREMLLWLHGLEQNDKTNEKNTLETYIATELTKKLQQSHSSVSTSIQKITTDAKTLIKTVCQDAGKIIVSIQKGQNNTNTDSLKSELKTQPLTYESDGQKLYEQFVYYLTCCYWQLKFLYTVCDVHAEVGGWGSCRYGSSVNNNCTKHDQRCQHCTKSKYTGCLQAFLTAQPNGAQGRTPGNNIYKDAKYSGNCNGSSSGPCTIPPMGFDKNNLPPSGNNQGFGLHGNLGSYLNDNQHDKSFPKLLGHLKLLELLGAPQPKGISSQLTAPKSWIAGDFWALFFQLKGNNTLRTNLSNQIKKVYENGFRKQSNTSTSAADYTDLGEVFSRLLFAEHNNTHPNCLLSLSECDGGKSKTNKDNSTNKCGKYLYSLFSDAFHHVVDWLKNNIDLLTFDALKKLAEELKKKLSALKSGLQGNKSKRCVLEQNCPCMVWCDDTHTVIYRYGFRLHTPASLNTLKRKCSDLKDQLEKVTAANSALNDFIGLQKFTPQPAQPPPTPPKPSAAKPVAAKPAAGGKTPSRARSEDDSSSGTPPSSSVSTPAAKPEAPKPQGAKPAATKPATSKPTGSGATSGIGDSSGSGTPGVSGSPGGGPSSGPVSPGGPGSDTKGSKGASTVAPPAAGPPPSPPQPPANSNHAATTTPAASNSAGGPKGRSDSASSGTVTLTVSNDNTQAMASIPGTNGGPNGKSSSSSTPTGGTTPSTTPPTGNKGVASTSPTTSQSTGTVHSRDNNKDGVDFWNTFKNSFDKVLKELKNTFTKVSESAIDTAVKATAIAVRELNAHHSSLLEPPCNVKECLEWLHIVCTNGNKDCQCQQRQYAKSCENCNAQHLSDAVCAILPGIKDTKVSVTKNTVLSVVREASTLFQHLKGQNYQPAYKLSAKWPTCGTAIGGTNSGVQCSCCKDNKCQCSTGSSPCDGTCCHRCDVRICAGIFIAMVPALEKALRELKERLNKEKYSKKLNEDPVKGYLEHLGYEERDLNDKKCNEVNYKLSSSLTHLGKIKSSIKDAFEGKNRKRNPSTHPCYFQVAKGSYTATTSVVATASITTPRTVREMLLWLMGLPYCQGYKDFVEKLNEKYKEHNKNSSTAKSTRKDINDYYHLHRQYSAVIFQLPVLFFTVEGTVSYLRDVFCQFAPEHNEAYLKKLSQDKNQDCNNKIGAFEYPCDGEQLCAVFYDYSYKVHLQLRFLLTMCDTEQKDGGWKHCRLAAGSAATRAVSTGAQECCSKHNLLCSCPDRKSKQSTTVSNSCRQLLREFLRDCETKDPKKCAEDPKKCTTDSSDAADHSSNNPVTRNIFTGPHVSMGFRVPECNHNKNDCCTLICHYTGEQIKGVLSGLVDESKGPSTNNNYNGSLQKPLSVVTQWMTALQGQDPRSLGDILDLFRELCVGSNRTRNASTSALGIGVRNGQEKKQMSELLSQQLGALLFDNYADYSSRTGAQTGAEAAKEEVAKIQVALYKVLDVQHHRSTTQRHTAQSQDSDPNSYSLVAIMGGCNSGRYNTCTAYVKSLSYGLYHYYSPEFKNQPNGATKNSSDHVLDWLFKWCKELYKGIKELKKNIVKCCNCCLEGGKERNDSNCTSIVACCQCPPELYRCGLVFGDPKTLMGNVSGRRPTAKKCSHFIHSVTNVLSTSAPVFKACEAIMTVVYHVLLMASRNKVYNYIVSLERKQEGPTAAQKELIVAFHRYVASAMQCSKKKLMETFLRPLCEGYECNGCDEECQKKDVEVSVSASNVTTITAVIPKYSQPVIDRYHYRAMTKIECCEDCKGKKSPEGNNSVSTQGNVLPACYTFQSALDFHVRGTNCILPVPANLRSAVDWILRITVGNTNGNNKMIQQLSEAIKKVLQHSGLTDSDVQPLVTALVEGLRTFMGYEDRSKDVISKVGTEKQSVQEQLKKNIQALNNFIGSEGSAQFGTELGIALQKAMFTVANGDKKTLKCVIGELQGKLTEKHTDCELKCNEFNKNTVDHKSSASVQADGLKLLEEFCKGLEQFYNDGEKYRRTGVIDIVIPSARNKIEHHNSTNDKLASGFFERFFTALSNLGQCQRYITDISPTGSGMTSSRVKNKLDMLINNLQRATKDLSDDEIRKIISACDIYMRVIHKESQCFIVNSIKQNIELECYEKQNGTLVIKNLLSWMDTVVSSRMDAFKSHLDDLKALCQWLYRMGQLYAHGLKGFVESLVKHLEHIVQVIKWIEGIEKMVKKLKGINTKDGVTQEINDLNGLSPCCNTSGHNNLYNSNKFTDRDKFFTALNCRINNLLKSYVLGLLPDGSKDKEEDKAAVATRRQFLRDLRLLALDRYTLQVWQDECNPNDNRPSAIMNWSIFEGGIVRHSDLNAVKTALQNLTGVAYNNASPPATPSASHRIHDFHAICVIQKFSYEAPIARLERSLEKLKGIKDKLSGVKVMCDGSTTNLSTDPTVTSFCTTVTHFLMEPYGVYSLAKFVHTIMGPNIFSAVIGALEELTTEKFKKLNGGEDKKKKFCGIVTTMCEGLESDKANKEHYTLTYICQKLKEFITTLRREYIFSYPVVCGTQSDKDCNAVCPGECDTEYDRKCSEKSKEATSLACSSQSSVTPSLRSATSTVSLTSSLPSLCAHCHVTSSICPECIPILARIFITLVPVLYPQLCYLAYQCRLYWCEQRIMDCNPLSSLLHTFGWPTECLNRDVYIDVRFIGHHVYWLLNKETNSLRLLCHNFTKDTDTFPFNTDSPLFKLYHLCLQYYRCRRSQSLTDSKRTPPVTPTTVRQILRFFVYLPFSTEFDALKCTMQRYCSQSRVVHYADLFATLMMSSAMSAVLLQLIECPQGSFLRFFDDIYTNKEGYHFDTNTETLFFQLCDLSVTLYRGLKFLSLQCSVERSFAGWKDCRLRGVKGNKESEDITQPLDAQHVQLCASHLCECQSIGAKDSSTTARMSLTAGSTVSTQPSHTTACSLPLLRYLTDANCFFDSRRTVQSALRKVCLNDSCQEMIYRHMAPRGWEKEMLQCAHRECQLKDSDPKVCYSACHLKNSDPNCSDYSNCGVSCFHPCCRAQCCGPVCSNVTGASLFQLLRNFVGHQFDADPLLQFTRYMVAIAAWPPDSLSGYMTFMLRFGDQLRKEERDTQRSVSEKNASQKKDWNSSVLSSLRSEITLFPGEFDPNCLIEAFVNVTHCEHNNGVAHTPVASPSTDTASDTTIVSPSSQCPTSSGVTISVLRDCKDCKCIIYPLDYEIYDLYLPIYARRYLTWMLHFGPRLHRGMRALEKAFKGHIEERSVSQSGASATDPVTSHSVTSQSHTSVQCHASMLQCPFALPELHSAGLHFWDPNRMCNVSCECLVDALQCSLKDYSVFAEFLRQCDRFLWSVRKPFYWVSMALWIVATVYLLFVHFWRLDLARLLSHVIRSRASHLVYPKVLLAAEQSYKQYYAPR